DRPAAAPTAPPVRAAAGILVDIDSGTILWQRNAHDSLPPASTIKLPPALVILDNFKLDTRITVTPRALQQASDETKMGLKPGEQLSVQELLTGMLTVSANDAADA